MTSLSCAEVRQLAAELAVGALPGDERAAALAHLEDCGECQVLVEELALAADALLLLAPEADPPAGFSSRVAAAFEPQVPRRRFRHRVVAVAAAAAFLLGGGAALATGVWHRGPEPKPVPFALHAPGVRMARFVAARGEMVGGQVFSYSGTPSWVFMTVQENASSETYACELELSDGTQLRIGTFRLHDGVGSWGRMVGVDANRIRAIRLIKGTAETAAIGSFQ